jgi:hypothetical protein
VIQKQSGEKAVFKPKNTFLGLAGKQEEFLGDFVKK